MIREVLSDNALNYTRSRDFAEAIAAIGAKHPPSSRTAHGQNGTVERFNRTVQVEWAYRQVFTSNAERAAALEPWLDFYNTRRRYSAIGGLPPISRLS